jgi:hypothetical protein
MKNTIIIPLVLLLAGCQKWLTITAVEQENQLYFESQELSEQCSDEEILVYSLGVSQAQCSNNCVRWELAVNANSTNSNPVAFPIEYGSPILGLEVRTQAQALVTGQFHISGNISCKGSDIGRVFGNFSLEVAQDGLIIHASSKRE